VTRFTLSFSLIQIPGQDLSLTIGICNVYARTIDRAFPDINHIGWRRSANWKCYTYIKQISDSDRKRLQELLEMLHDTLCLTITPHLKPHFSKELAEVYALDLNFKPDIKPLEYTRTGSLEHVAKEKKTPAAIRELAKALALTIQHNPTLARVDNIVAMPTRPSKTFHLPVQLVAQVGRILKRPVGLGLTKDEHPKLRGLPIAKKVATLKDKFYLAESVKGKSVLIIDDLYQSGTSAWALAKFLKQNGAREVYALACVKSWRDTDNT
jgi:predicted amidophosphoribosyltransferase